VDEEDTPWEVQGRDTERPVVTAEQRARVRGEPVAEAVTPAKAVDPELRLKAIDPRREWAEDATLNKTGLRKLPKPELQAMARELGIKLNKADGSVRPPSVLVNAIEPKLEAIRAANDLPSARPGEVAAARVEREQVRVRKARPEEIAEVPEAVPPERERIATDEEDLRKLMAIDDPEPVEEAYRTYLQAKATDQLENFPEFAGGPPPRPRSLDVEPEVVPAKPAAKQTKPFVVKSDARAGAAVQLNDEIMEPFLKHIAEPAEDLSTTGEVTGVIKQDSGNHIYTVKVTGKKGEYSVRANHEQLGGKAVEPADAVNAERSGLKGDVDENTPLIPAKLDGLDVAESAQYTTITNRYKTTKNRLGKPPKTTKARDAETGELITLDPNPEYTTYQRLRRKQLRWRRENQPQNLSGGAYGFVGKIRHVNEIANGLRQLDPTGEKEVWFANNIVGRGVDPSIKLRNTPVNELNRARIHQQAQAQMQMDASLQVALDSLNAVGRVDANSYLKIDTEGFMREVTGKTAWGRRNTIEGKGAMWMDVFARPDDFNLTPEQLKYIGRYRTVMEELHFMLQEEGLDPPPLTNEEWFYIPRKATGADYVHAQLDKNGDLTFVTEPEGFRRPSNPKLSRVYETGVEGWQAGTHYLSDPRQVLKLHGMNAFHQIINNQYDEAFQSFSATGKELLMSTARGRELYEEVGNTFLAHNRTSKRIRALRKQIRGLELGAVPAEEYGPGMAAAAKKIRKTRTPARKAMQAEVKDLLLQLNKDADIHRRAKAKVARELENIRSQAPDVSQLRPGEEGLIGFMADPEVVGRGRIFPEEAVVRREFMFGPRTEKVPLVRYRERYIALSDGEAMAELARARGPAHPAWEKFEKLGNTIRMFSAGIDFAAQMVQGQTVFGTSPKAWSKGFLNQMKAFADPKVQAKAIEEYLPHIQEMGRYGVPVGDSEAYAAIQRGGGFEPGAGIEKILKHVVGDVSSQEARRLMQNFGRNTLGRFQAAYNTYLTTARAELWRALRPTWRESLEDLAVYVRNSTGGLDTRQLAVSPNQRALESMFLGFSPRLLRSTMSLVSDLRRNPLKGFTGPEDFAQLIPGFGPAPTTRGAAAYRALGGLAAYAQMTYVLGGMMLMAAGRVDQKDILTGLNPLEGKKYLSFKIGDTWVGWGGQTRALVQFLSNTASAFATGDVDKFTTFDPQDNPLLNYYYSRGSVGLTAAGTAIEAGTEGRFNAMPYESFGRGDGPTNGFFGQFHLGALDNAIEATDFIGTSMLPFAAQGALGQATIGEVVTEGPRSPEGVEGIVPSFSGFRTSGATPYERIQRDVGEAIENLEGRGYVVPSGVTKYTEWTYLPAPIKQEAERLNPDAVAEAQRFEDEQIAQIEEQEGRSLAFQSRDAAAEAFRTDVLNLVQYVNAGQATHADLRLRYNDLQSGYRAVSEAQDRDLFREQFGFDLDGEPPPASENQLARDIYEYHQIFEAYPDANFYMEEREELFEELEAFRAQIGPQREADLDANIGLNVADIPEIQELKNARRAISDSGYWDVEDQVWDYFRSWYPSIPEGIHEYRRDQLFAWRRAAEQYGYNPALGTVLMNMNDPLLRVYDTIVDKARYIFLAQNPGIIPLLDKYGYKATAQRDIPLLEMSGMNRTGTASITPQDALGIIGNYQ
jgi:hypothetical protein